LFIKVCFQREQNLLDCAMGKGLGGFGRPGQKLASSQVQTGSGRSSSKSWAPVETHRTEGDIHAHYGTCIRERARGVLHGSGFGRDQKSGSIGSIG
jgi:hypothetical protein